MMRLAPTSDLWWKNAVVYCLDVETFHHDFDGLIDHIDHIADLGATCVWLTPVFPSPSHHGYDTTDYLGVERRLGTEDDLRELIEAVHARGMRIVLDFVANHASSRHPAFQAALADRDAPEALWFTFTDWPDHYLSFFGVRDHPQLDTDDPGARDHLIAAGRKWLALGVDGFRCDYANGPSHAFWSQFRVATRAASPGSALLGEIVETPALWRTYRGRLDGCLDFILLQALRGAFAFGTVTPSELDAFLRRHLAFAEGDWVQPSFLDNHDMNRFLWVVGGDTRRLKLAALCQFTLPDPPIVYYGTEVGLSQTRDVRYADGSGHPEESRLPMPWGDTQDRALLAFYRDLVALRRSSPGRWRGERVTLTTDDEAGLYAYRAADATVVLNLAAATAGRWPVPPGAGEPALMTVPEVHLASGVLELPAYAGAVLLTG